MSPWWHDPPWHAPWRMEYWRRTGDLLYFILCIFLATTVGKSTSKYFLGMRFSSCQTDTHNDVSCKQVKFTLLQPDDEKLYYRKRGQIRADVMFFLHRQTTLHCCVPLVSRTWCPVRHPGWSPGSHTLFSWWTHQAGGSCLEHGRSNLSEERRWQRGQLLKHKADIKGERRAAGAKHGPV